MKIYFAADHAGFELKHALLTYVRGELGMEVEDCGASTMDPQDDYPALIARAAKKLQADAAHGIESRAILLGASGQGEAIAANRFEGVRCAVYYGAASRTQKDASGTELDIVASVRAHNDTNALSLGARFVDDEEARTVVRAWLAAPFSGDERHARRNAALDHLA